MNADNRMDGQPGELTEAELREGATALRRDVESKFYCLDCQAYNAVGLYVPQLLRWLGYTEIEIGDFHCQGESGSRDDVISRLDARGIK